MGCKGDQHMSDKFKELENSPIYVMSLGSKELFHSNLWAWLIKDNPEYVNAFFDDIDVDQVIDVKREYDHFDIMFEAVGKDNKKTIYVIENKFKSIPYQEQLEQYSKKLTEKVNNKKVEYKCCLASVLKPNFELAKWSFCSYKDILTKIKEIATKEKEIFKKDIIIGYCDIFLDLISVLTDTLDKDNKVTLDCKLKRLKALRVHDIYAKLKAEKLAEYTENNFKPKQKIADFVYKTKIDYSNQSANFTVKYEKKEKNNDDLLEIGVQIQADVLKHYVYIKKAGSEISSKDSRMKIFNSFTESGWFDKDYIKGKTTVRLLEKDRQTKMKSTEENDFKFNAYKYKDAVFIYQHYKMDQIENYEALCDIFKDVFKVIEEKKLTDKLIEVYNTI